MPTPPLHVIRRRPASPPVYLLEVLAERGGRTHAHGALWDGVLNASPEDDVDGPSPVEALLAGVAACFVRNLRWVADGAHVEFARIALRLAAGREDDPPALNQVRLEADLMTDAAPARVAGIVERALRSGTITRTVGRAAGLEVVVRINGVAAPIRVPTWNARQTRSGSSSL
jgi:uncharacterized OsmC-like protein